MCINFVSVSWKHYHLHAQCKFNELPLYGSLFRSCTFLDITWSFINPWWHSHTLLLQTSATTLLPLESWLTIDYNFLTSISPPTFIVDDYKDPPIQILASLMHLLHQLLKCKTLVSWHSLFSAPPLLVPTTKNQTLEFTSLKTLCFHQHFIKGHKASIDTLVL